MGRRGIVVVAVVAAVVAGLLAVGVYRGTTPSPGLPNPNVSTTTTEPCIYFDPAKGYDPQVAYCPWVPS